MKALKKSRAMQLLAAVLIVSLPFLLGLVEPKHLSKELRHRSVPIASFTVSASTDTTPGTNGVSATKDIHGTDGGFAADAGFVDDAGFAADAGLIAGADAGATQNRDAAALDAIAFDAAPIDGGNFADSPTIAAPKAIPYCAPLKIILIDGSTATSAALTCTSFTVIGFDCFGNTITETVTSISETASYTLHAFAAASLYTVTGCAGGQDSGDLLQVGLGTKIGTPIRFRASRDILAGSFVHSGARTAFTGAELDTAGALNYTYWTVDLGDVDLSAQIVAGDTFLLEMLPWVPLP